MPSCAHTAPADSHYATTAVAREMRAPLAADLRTDACVVGGGIAGLATALELAEAGRSVVLLDLFAPFGTRWGGGPAGRAATQLAYWWYQVRDRIDEATHRQEAER